MMRKVNNLCFQLEKWLKNLYISDKMLNVDIKSQNIPITLCTYFKYKKYKQNRK